MSLAHLRRDFSCRVVIEAIRLLQGSLLKQSLLAKYRELAASIEGLYASIGYWIKVPSSMNRAKFFSVSLAFLS